MSRPSNKGKPRPKPDHHSKNTGPGKPSGIKSTDEEIKRMVQQCVELIALRRTKHEIMAAMCRQYGVSARTAEEYTSRARLLMEERANRPKKDFVQEAIGLYENVIKDAQAPRRERLIAQMGLNELLGLNAPKRAEISGPEGAPIAFGEVKVYVPAKRPLVLSDGAEVESARVSNGEASGETGNGEG